MTVARLGGLFMSNTKANFKAIPIIDVGSLVKPGAPDSERRKTAQLIGEACRYVGFFYIKNHGVPEEHREMMFKEMKRFFDLPEDRKMKLYIGNSDQYTGYIPLGGEVTERKKDWHACLDFHAGFQNSRPDGHTLNDASQFPTDMPEFKALIMKNWDLMLPLCATITEGLALSLGLDADYFKRYTNKSLSTLRLSFYPPFEKPYVGDEVDAGIGAHCDYGFLTVLAQDQSGGLEVKNAAGEWISAPYVPGTFIVNIGQMTQQWTNDNYRATWHRVLLSESRERFSIPFFFEPDYDAIVEPLPSCCDAQNPPKYEPCHFGEFIISKYSRSYAEHYDG